MVYVLIYLSFRIKYNENWTHYLKNSLTSILDDTWQLLRNPLNVNACDRIISRNTQQQSI